MSHIIQQKMELQNSDNEGWIADLANVVTDLTLLYRYLELNPKTISPSMYQAKKSFPLRVPTAFIRRMKKGDLNDPLLRQVLCSDDEMVEVAGYSHDPLKEQNSALPGLLHKYHNRALVLTKTACAVNCRYCFRRHFPYQENQSNRANLAAIIDYIAKHPELDEIILSGGDPLMAKDHEIASLLSALEQIPHLKRLRIHTRLAVVIPSRITAKLLQLFAKSRLQILLVTHINHPNEIDSEVVNAMQQLKQHQVTLLNQSVLLKGVNDDATILAELSDKLFDTGILPYYLHLLDRVAGAAHFFVDDDRAKAIMRELSAKISGYLVPKLAREVGGEKSKRVINLFES